MRVVVSMRKALADPQLLAGALPGKSWSAWRILLMACAGERLLAAERKVFKTLTGRDREPGHMVDLFLGVVGRRGGKSRAMAVFITWLATCCDWTDVLSLGERGIALIVAPTERQAAITRDYVTALVESAPLLQSLVEDRTQNVLRLKGQIDIEIMAANARTVRGVTCIAVCLDESAFLPSNEDAATSDVSLLQSLRPTVSTTSGPMVLTSSPLTMTGIVYTLWKKHYGPNGSPDVIVAQAATTDTNPKFKQSVVDKAFEDDAESAGSEYGGQFREPMSAYLSRSIIEFCVEKGMLERQPLANMGIVYQGFVDQAGGNGSDSFTACIAHTVREGDRDVKCIDALFEFKPPFDPLDVVAALAEHFTRYGIKIIQGDGYAGNFVASAFAKRGIAFHQCKLSASELYIAALPAFTSKTVVLLDQPRAVDQFINLRRKIGSGGAESVTHMRGQHDDLANAIAGVIHMLTPREQAMPTSWDIPGAITAPRFDPYAGPDAQADYYMRRRMEYGPNPSNGRSIHDGAPIKGSPLSNRNAVTGP